MEWLDSLARLLLKIFNKVINMLISIWRVVSEFSTEILPSLFELLGWWNVGKKKREREIASLTVTKRSLDMSRMLRHFYHGS